MTSLIHDIFVAYFCQRLSVSIESWIRTIAPSHTVRLQVSPTFCLEGVSVRKKVPDAALKVLPRDTLACWPQMVLEVGYSQSESDLRRVAKCWLLGTRGAVRSVLLVKFCKPGPMDFGDWTKWKGWVEIWVPSSRAR
jgi:hypothetical protein